jgi:uncharacterized protein YgiM (DUF1202 family)
VLGADAAVSVPGLRTAASVALDAEGNLYAAAGTGIVGLTSSGIAWGPVETPQRPAGMAVAADGTIVFSGYTLGGTEARIVALRVATGAEGEPVAPFPAAAAVVDTDRLNVRSGPSTDASILTVVERDDSLPVTGRNAGGTWLQVRTPDDKTGWVYAQLVNFDGDIEALPVAP